MLTTRLHLSSPIPFCRSVLTILAMLLAIALVLSSVSLLKIVLYSPMCLPDGDVVVDSRHFLNRLASWEVVMDGVVSSCSL